jgi:hypothetical protein
MRCKMSPNGRHYAPYVHDWDPVGLGPRVTRSCCYCYQYVALGESNDSSADVKAEIRAAEIAADLAAGGCLMSPLEICGFNDEWPTLRGGGHVRMDTESQRAGYLACVIASHDEVAP